MRCAICDYSLDTPSIFNSGLTLEKPGVLKIRDGVPLCNSCDIIEQNDDRELAGELPMLDPEFDL